MMIHRRGGLFLRPFSFLALLLFLFRGVHGEECEYPHVWEGYILQDLRLVTNQSHNLLVAELVDQTNTLTGRVSRLTVSDMPAVMKQWTFVNITIDLDCNTTTAVSDEEANEEQLLRLPPMELKVPPEMEAYKLEMFKNETALTLNLVAAGPDNNVSIVAKDYSRWLNSRMYQPSDWLENASFFLDPTLNRAYVKFWLGGHDGSQWAILDLEEETVVGVVYADDRAGGGSGFELQGINSTSQLAAFHVPCTDHHWDYLFYNETTIGSRTAAITSDPHEAVPHSTPLHEAVVLESQPDDSFAYAAVHYDKHRQHYPFVPCHEYNCSNIYDTVVIRKVYLASGEIEDLMVLGTDKLQELLNLSNKWEKQSEPFESDPFESELYENGETSGTASYGLFTSAFTGLVQLLLLCVGIVSQSRRSTRNDNSGM